ncbi:hypothetical protein TPHA_0F01090 [Tetrapisispora phaffii CBS 4417]|uniref:BAH domain-containing protein n=1 Tax=Tetrapisispora phaffii (strain ATCC 24235 / CBS 4417 / NBRC 1672 / NRRL Y-8282 / UCD 70-5) TaxID=1071381 RepID=G8BV12_TETPH|nr:hypothetical protein TPHA_0F01090 [Tetrapisispora phaffii CBS 4417]CCE63594.1 hypothetical protein TPHA_0F01090 [Tetrapisispora phaffii CBS 4417]
MDVLPSNNNGTNSNTELYTILKTELDKLCLLKFNSNEFPNSDPAKATIPNNISISLIFKELPSREDYPDYYNIIRNPMSLDMIYKRLENSQYDSIYKLQSFVDDIAQISKNARYFYNMTTIIHKFANLLDNYLKAILIPFLNNKFNMNLSIQNDQNDQQEQNVNALNVISNSNLYEQQVAVTQQRIQLSPSPPIQQQFQSQYLKHTHNNQQRKHIRRGRPPIIDFPYVQRIKNVFKMLKKEIDQAGESLTSTFEKLPVSIEEYKQIIDNPMTLEDVRKNVRGRKYKDFMTFKKDMDLMLSNYQTYNLYKDHKQNLKRYEILFSKFNLYCEVELNKPDKDFIPESGDLRYPLNEVKWGNVLYSIGDWVLLKNPNDEAKPIVGQIFKMWNTTDGKIWLNVCWYFRPEQTVHRYDRLFYKNEVVKSGQYRDHTFTSVLGKCYVVHFTRFQRGDPANIKNLDIPLFICEYRYNENDKNFNKIRTWRACMPEEIRDQEEVTIPVPGRKFFKYLSPLAHLLSPTATFTDPIPEATAGAHNGPPAIGAVYIRPVLEKDDLGEYSTSPDCPRYIIRPNDPQPEGIIDFKNGIIVTKESSSHTVRRSSSCGSTSGGHVHARKPKPETPKININDLNMKSMVSTMHNNNDSFVSKPNIIINKSTYNQVTNEHTYLMNRKVMPKKAIIFNNKIPIVTNKIIQTNTTTKVKKPSTVSYSRHVLEKVTTETQVKNMKRYQEKATNTRRRDYNLSSIVSNLTNKASKSSLGKIIIETPNSYVLSIPLNSKFNTLQKCEKRNKSEKTPHNISVNNNPYIADVLWFKGPGINVSARMVNSGVNLSSIALNTWKKRRRVHFDEVEESIEVADDDAVFDSDDERVAEPDDVQEMPDMGLKPSASYIAYRMRQSK